MDYHQTAWKISKGDSSSRTETLPQLFDCPSSSSMPINGHRWVYEIERLSGSYQRHSKNSIELGSVYLEEFKFSQMLRHVIRLVSHKT